MNTVSFPGLGIGEFTVNPDAFSIGSFSIKWYAICICLGLILAFFYGERKAKYFGISSDDFLDLILICVPAGLIGARVGYILMDLDSFDDFKSMISVWNGGLSIYGGLIAAFLAIIITCKFKKINMFSVLDLAGSGILIGQIVGRFGNFFNIEVYGVQTNLPWRMGIGYNGIAEYVHPLFLYEALWNLIGFVLILAFLDQRKFKGEVFLWYTGWYGLGRAWMEALRDSEFQLMAGSIKINQMIAVSAFVLSLAVWIFFRFVKTSVHFESSEIEKELSIKELHKLHIEQAKQREEDMYDSQFSEQLEEDAGISEEEFIIKDAFDKLDQAQSEEE